MHHTAIVFSVFLSSLIFVSVSYAKSASDIIKEKGWQTTKQIASDAKLDVYEVKNSRTDDKTYVILHHIGPNEKFIEFDEDEYGNYTVSQSFLDQISDWGIKPQLDDYRYASMRSMHIHHYVEGFTHPESKNVSLERPEHPVFYSAYYNYAESPFGTYQRFTKFDKPPATLNELKIKLGILPEKTVEEMPGDPAPTKQVKKTENQDEKSDFPKEQRERLADDVIAEVNKFKSDLTTILRELAISHINVEAFTYGGSFTECNSDLACNYRICQKQIDAARYDAGRQDFYKHIRGLLIDSEKDARAPNVRWFCGYYLAQNLHATMPNYRAKNTEDYVLAKMMFQHGLAQFPNVLKEHLLHLTYLFAYSEDQLKDAKIAKKALVDANLLSKKDQIHYATFEKYIENKDITKELGLNPKYPALLRDGFKPPVGFYSNSKFYKYNSVYDAFKALATQSNQPPWLYFRDDNETLFLFYIDLHGDREFTLETINMYEFGKKLKTEGGIKELESHPIVQYFYNVQFTPTFKTPQMVFDYLAKAPTYAEVMKMTNAN